MISYSFSLYDLEYFLFILCRVTAFVFICPFFGTRGVPNQVKIIFSVFTSLLLYQNLTPVEHPVEYQSVFGFAMIVTKETVTGLILGLGSNMCMSIVNFAGSIADMETGLSMATLIDPTTNQNTSITGVLYQYAMMLMLIASGMYRYFCGTASA